MLILVKDFEVISNIENKIDNSIYAVNVDLNEFTTEIKEIVEALIKKKNSTNPLSMIVNVDKAIPFFRTDSMRLKQILINLISNSIKFTEVGFIELRIDKANIIEDDHLDTFNYDNKSSQDLQRIKISVIDTGKGISIEKQENLFSSLTKEQSENNILGAGYGLGIVKNLCLMLDSDIHYSENDPHGSIFYFYLSEKSSNNENCQKCLSNINNLNNKNSKNEIIEINEINELYEVNDANEKKINNDQYLYDKDNLKFKRAIIKSQRDIETLKQTFNLKINHQHSSNNPENKKKDSNLLL